MIGNAQHLNFVSHILNSQDLDYNLVINEANKLTDQIKKDDLFRKGLFLYDNHKSRYIYSIAEYVWSRCSHPFIAQKVTAYLEDHLRDEIQYMLAQDINSINTWIYSNWGLIEQGVLEQPNSTLSIFFHIYLSDKCAKYMIGQDAVEIHDMLIELQKSKWEPATYFLKKFEPNSKHF
jgi:hypothetical protein